MDNSGIYTFAANERGSGAIGEKSGDAWSSNLVCATPLRPNSGYLRELEIESPDVMVIGMKSSLEGIVKMRVGTCVNV